MKTNLTNSKYQSTFLPIIQKAETQIKKLILYYSLKNKPLSELRQKIKGIIIAVEYRLPIGLVDSQTYIKGLETTSEKMIKEFYKPVVFEFLLLVSILISANLIKKAPQNPLELNKIIKRTPRIQNYLKTEYKVPSNMWKEAKGSAWRGNYPEELKAKIKELSNTKTVSSGDGKHPISIWQKAEIDLRHENQMKMVEELKSNGVRYAYTSSHPDCSKRCERWQGKLFDLTTETSGRRDFKLGKLDGRQVYCFNDVIRQVDKYGYTNNIIVGFNCRHKLIEYKGQIPPKEYSAKDIKEQRKINAKLRQMERQIRFYKQQAILYNKTDKKLSQINKRKAEILTNSYKKFAEQNGYAWYQYRINV